VEQLIKTLPAIVSAGSNSPEVISAAAVAAWRFVAGPVLSKHAVATKLTDRTLIVTVSDAIWQKQLESMQGSLRLRLNAMLGKPLIGRLAFHLQHETIQD
jgi:predicted nucleic acid-binding Zn ribbon protein